MTSWGIRRIRRVEQHDVGDRQLDALLARLDRIADELERLNRGMERQDGLQLVAREIHDLQESLNALAYAALGHAPPQVRRRAS
jgi:HPt (histidine-containing phosphotransfer) domain-containing protein